MAFARVVRDGDQSFVFGDFLTTAGWDEST